MDERARTLTCRAILMGVSLVALDQTIVATALPRITADLGGTDRYAWVATAYLITSVLVMMPAGRLVDVVNSRVLLLGSTALFLAGSFLCGASPTMNALIASRALQGIGGGALMSTNAAVLGLLYTPRERGAVMGTYTAAIALSNVLGPLLGGILSDMLGWHSVFYINMPLGGIALFYLWKYTPDQAPACRAGMDWAGAWLLAAALLPLLVALSLAGTRFPWLSAPVLGALGVAVAMFFVFIVLESRHPSPLFDLNLFRDPVFAWAAIACLITGANTLGAVVYLPMYLVGVAGISATVSGLVLCPLMLGATLGSTWTGRVVRTTGQYHSLLVAGSSLNVGMLLIVQRLLASGAAVPWILGALLPLGISFGLLLPAFTVAVQNSVPRERMGTATSAVQFFRTLGSSLGMTVMGTILALTLHQALPQHLSPQAARHGVQDVISGFEEESALHQRFERRVADLETDIRGALQGDTASRGRLATHPLLDQSLREGVARAMELHVLEQRLNARVVEVGRGLENAVHVALRATLIDSTAAIFLFMLVISTGGAVACFCIPQRTLGAPGTPLAE